MQRSFVTIALCSLLVSILELPASAKAIFFRVTPATTHRSSPAIVVTTHRANGTTQFTILLQARHGYTLSPFHSASIADYDKYVQFSHWQLPNDDPKRSRTLVSLSNRGGLHYQFTVPDSQLSSTLFTYEDEGYVVNHGKVRMVSANFLWFRCRDFAR